MIRKGIIAAAACALVLIFSLSFYFWLKPMAANLKPGDAPYLPFKKNGFWYISLVWNDGVGFSALRGNLAAIFSIQTIVFLLLFGFYLFLCQDNITSSFIACAVFGGLFNLIQRGAVSNHCVLDYFHFGFWESFPTFNWPDMFVVIGVFGFIIAYIVLLVKQSDKEDEQKTSQQEANASAAQ